MITLISGLAVVVPNQFGGTEMPPNPAEVALVWFLIGLLSVLGLMLGGLVMKLKKSARQPNETLEFIESLDDEKTGTMKTQEGEEKRERAPWEKVEDWWRK